MLSLSKKCAAGPRGSSDFFFGPSASSVVGRVLTRQRQRQRPSSSSTTATATATSTNRRRARVLVVGTGRMGTIRASLVYSNPRFDLCGIVDPDLAAAQDLAAKYRGSGGAKPYASLTEAIEHSYSARTTGEEGAGDYDDGGPPLDGIIVCSPTFTHAAVIEEAADRGLSVFTEKPVAETADEIERLFDRAAAAGIALCCGYQRRFDPSYAAAADAVRNGDVGTPVVANAFFGDHPGASREFLLAGGNIFMDLLVHDVDYITHTLQDEVVSIYATGTSSDAELAAAGVHDNATAVMNLKGGAVVTVFMSRSAVYGYDQRCEIFGTKGLVSVNNAHETTAVLSNASGIHRSRLQHSFPERFHESFGIELDAFCDTLLLNRTWPVTAEQCVRVQRVADAAQQSNELGQVVQL